MSPTAEKLPRERRISLRVLAALSLLFTYLFFAEYLSPLRRVHIPYDLEGYHYSLQQYGFEALKHGRFPEWDPTIYCGISFAANVQAALFYPPVWLMFAANLGHERLSYQSLQICVVAHVWLAFLLCYVWLRGRQLSDLACVLGAGVFAFSGYMCLQLQHFGLVGGYTWFPLGLMGIDQAVQNRRWQPLWKLVAASALCFLAGYPPTWFVFAVCMMAYALAGPWRSRAVLGAAASLGASLLVAMVQVLPAWELSRFMVREPRYGSGVEAGRFLLSYWVPNYFNFGMNVPLHENPGKEYLYLGVPALLGIACLLRRRNPRDLAPFVAIAVVSLVLAMNPYNLVWSVIKHSSLLAEICRDWYFLAGLTLAAVPLTAYGLDSFLRQRAGPVAGWLVWLAVALQGGWSSWELARWLAGGLRFASGWRSVYDPAITLAIFTLGFWVLRGQRGTARTVLAIALVLGVGVDYKVFGTSKRFNAGAGSGQTGYRDSSFPGMDPDIYRQLRTHPEYRILLDQTGPHPLQFRHAGLTTPQGFDPFFSTQFSELLQGIARFRNNWEFDIDPDRHDALRLFGIRYVVTSETGPFYPRLQADPSFRGLSSERDFYRVFEYKDARPVFGWEMDSDDRQVTMRTWTPESREFRVRSASGGQFTLQEQFLPGWQASIDGKPTTIDRWNAAFQAVPVPPGEHTVQFRFRSNALRLGAWISLLSLIGLGWIAARRH